MGLSFKGFTQGLQNLNILNLKEIKEPQPPAGLEQAAAESASIGRESLAFQKQVYEEGKTRNAELDALTKEVVASYLKTQEKQSGQADDYINYMKTTFRPIEQALAKDAMTAGSPEEQEAAAAKDRAAVASSYESARGTAGREMARMGVNPNSGRFGEFMKTTYNAQAADEAGSMNLARDREKTTGRAFRMGVAGLGAGLPGAASNASQVGMQAGAGAVGAGSVTANNARADAQLMNTGYAMDLGGLNQSGGLYSNIYQGGINTWANKLSEQRQQKTQRNEILQDWMGAGFAMSSRKAKVKRGEVKDAEILAEVKKLPVDRWRYKKAVTDDQSTHIGTYAEDFKERFGVGDGKVIHYIDAIGVNLAAVKGLAKQVDQLQSRVATIAREGIRHG